MGFIITELFFFLEKLSCRHLFKIVYNSFNLQKIAYQQFFLYKIVLAFTHVSEIIGANNSVDFTEYENQRVSKTSFVL